MLNTHIKNQLIRFPIALRLWCKSIVITWQKHSNCNAKSMLLFCNSITL